jgi:PAS domain S-box-containing protein
MDAVAVIDRHGTILSVNPELQAQFGYAPEEMIGANVTMLMPPDHAARHDDYLAGYLPAAKRRSSAAAGASRPCARTGRVSHWNWRSQRRKTERCCSSASCAT